MEVIDATGRYKPFKILGFSTSKKELIDLSKAWVVISLVFAILFGNIGFNLEFLSLIIISGMTVGTGFLFHELGHKIVAQKYKCYAEFRSFDNYLLLAFLMSFLGFVFIAPGAVMISGRVTKRTNGIISAAGPLVNFVLALMFLIVNLIFPNPISIYGIKINAFLGLFNMIPFWMFDGKKIWIWNQKVWVAMLIIGLIIVNL